MNRLIAVLLLAALMAAARWAPIQELIQVGHRATVSLGFILVFGYLVGHYSRVLGLPGITGYILAGILCGPFVGRFLTPPVVSELQLIDDLALALIAFTAGGELRIKSLLPRIRSIVGITVSQTAICFLGLAGTVVLLYRWVPALADHPIPVYAAALVFGLFGVATSPATSVAIIAETRARGPFTDTVLGVVILKDVLVLVLITLILPFVQILASPGTALDLHLVSDLAWEVGGSLLGGVVLGFLVTFYMRGVGAVLPCFIVGTSILVVQAARQLHLEPLLLCMVAGFVIENATSLGDRFIAAIERSVLPVYVVFFAIGGASLDLGALRTTWVLALTLTLVRVFLLTASTALGEKAARVRHRGIERRGWMGFIAQAGVTLGLVSIVSRKFPGWGDEVKTIGLAMIALNQLLGPIAFRWALLRSGEARPAPALRESV